LARKEKKADGFVPLGGREKREKGQEGETHVPGVLSVRAVEKKKKAFFSGSTGGGRSRA